MEQNIQEKELTTFGFVGNNLRKGIVTGIIAVLCTAVAYLFIENRVMTYRIIDMQENCKNEIIEEVRKQITPLNHQVTEATRSVQSTALQVDSLITSKK